MERLAVLKFGGSSLANSAKVIFISQRIKSFLKKYRKLIVVVSAPGDITDDLLKMSDKFKSDPRTLDMLVSCGESISICLVKMALNSLNLKSIALNQYQIPIITDLNYSNAKIISVNTDRLGNLFKKYDIIIIPGFIGITRNLDITTLGRGGSDYTAVYFADKLNADCYLLSDIKGVYSANPSRIEYAKKLDEISYKELFEISKLDSEIRHNKAMRYAMLRDIKLYLGSSFHQTTPTLIKNYSYQIKPLIKYLSVVNNGNKTIISLIGENIKKRKDVISNLRSITNKMIISQNKITLKFNKIVDDDFIKKIHSKFILN